MAAPAFAPTAIKPPSEFDVARRRAQQQADAQTQKDTDAIQRRAAAMSGGPGGALIKVEQQARDVGAQRLQDANEGIDAAEQAELKRVREIQEGRAFQTAEREGTQKFAATQADLQRKYEQGQFEKTFGLQKDAFGLQKDTAATQKELAIAGITGLYKGSPTMAKLDMIFNQQVAEAGLTGTYKGDDTLAKQAFDDQKSMAEKEFEQNLKTNYINTIISAYNSKIPPEQIGAILQELGVTYDKQGRPTVGAGSVPGLTAPKPEAPKPVAPARPAEEKRRPTLGRF